MDSDHVHGRVLGRWHTHLDRAGCIGICLTYGTGAILGTCGSESAV